MIRQPAVSGLFYPGESGELRKQVESMIPDFPSPQPVRGLIVPHAGYIYSGECAGQAYSRAEFSDTVVILGVNHRGAGPSLAVDGHSAWRTPLGDVEVDAELRERLISGPGGFRGDLRNGLSEHSLEVQVPFIQVKAPTVRILPISVGGVGISDLIEAGEALAAAIPEDRGKITLLASTDMSHYVEAGFAEKQDRLAIEKILDMDSEGLARTVISRRISMCGVGPTVILLSALKRRGANRVEEICYTHSGKVTGDDREVVAYWSGLVL